MRNNRTPAERPRLLRRLGWSAVAGIAAAAALTVFNGTVRHAALASPGRPAAAGPALSPGFVLASDFLVTFIVVTTVLFITAASRRSRRAPRPAAAARRGGARRRPAARSGRA